MVCGLPIFAANPAAEPFLDLSAGTVKVRVPWTELQWAQGDYIDSKYLPEQVTLKQYYHLVQEDVNALLEHWTGRQAAGEVPLSFKKVAKTVRPNKHILEESDTDTDTRQDEEEGGGLPKDDGSKAQLGSESQGGAGSNH